MASNDLRRRANTTTNAREAKEEEDSTLSVQNAFSRGVWII